MPNQPISVKHQALYTYLIRVIRPVWELKLIGVAPNETLVSNSVYFGIV